MEKSGKKRKKFLEKKKRRKSFRHRRPPAAPLLMSSAAASNESSEVLDEVCEPATSRSTSSGVSTSNPSPTSGARRPREPPTAQSRVRRPRKPPIALSQARRPCELPPPTLGHQWCEGRRRPRIPMPGRAGKGREGRIWKTAGERAMSSPMPSPHFAPYKGKRNSSHINQKKSGDLRKSDRHYHREKTPVRETKRKIRQLPPPTIGAGVVAVPMAADLC